MKYQAFISYSHAADGRLAPALQAGLHRFAKKWHQLRALRVFLDKSSLSPSAGLRNSIRSALVESKYFLLMASPDAAESEWVCQEIGIWLEKKENRKRTLIVLTEGKMQWDNDRNDFDWDITDALAEETLKGRFQEEPLFVDLRWAKSETDLSLRNARFKDDVAGIASTLHGRPKDELIGDDVREHKKTLLLARASVTALVVLIIAVGITAFVALQQRDSAQQFLGRVQTSSGLQLVEEGDSWGGLIWFAEALRWDNDDSRRKRAHRVRIGSYLNSLPTLVHVLKHDQPVNTAEFSPDGKRVVTGVGAVYSREGTQGSARVWNAITGDPVTGELPHKGAVYSASFSPDGLRVVTAGGDKTVRIWDAVTGEELLSLPHNKLVRRAFYSPDGGRILTASGKVRVWDAFSGELLASREEPDWNIWHASFSPDGERVIALTANPYMEGGSNALLWDPRTDVVKRLPVGGFWGYDGSFSPDGTKVVTAGKAGNAQIWNVATGKPIGMEMQHEDRVAHASFSPDGKLVLTAGWDGTARLWLANNGEPLTTKGYNPKDRIPRVFRHGGQIKYASFSPNGQLVATASTDGFVRVWNTARGNAVTDPLPFSHFNYPAGTGGQIGDTSPGAEFYFSFSPDGQRLVTAGWDGTARIWDLTPSGLAIGPTKVEPALTEDIPLFTGFKLFGILATLPPRVVTLNTQKSTIIIRDPLTLRHIGTPPSLDKPAGEAVLSADGKRLATVDAVAGNFVRVWDVETGRTISPPLEHEHYVAYAEKRHVAFSPNGRRLATINNGNNPQVGIVRLWNLESGNLVFPPIKHDSWVKDIAFDNEGKRLATARSAKGLLDDFEGGQVQIWDTESGLPLGPKMRHSSTVKRVWFTPDDQRIVTLESYGLDKSNIRIWDADTGVLETKIVHTAGEVNAIAFSTDGRFFATAGAAQAARIWDLASGKAVTPWLKHRGNGYPSIFLPKGLTSVAFSPDGYQLATGSVDHTVRIWELESGLPLTPFIDHGEPILELAFDPAGSQVRVLGSGGLFSVWNFAPDNRPIEELVRLTQIMGVRRLDETGSLVQLELGEFLDRWSGHDGRGREPVIAPSDASRSTPN